MAHGDPDIRAGAQVKISGLGQRLSGTYDVTSTTHTVTPGVGYETRFAVRGRRRGTLIELASGGGAPESRRLGPVIGIVTNVKDEDNEGKVKVKFPWLSDADESAWARLSSPMAGPDRGLQLVPEVDDEVLVVFERGDPNRPIVIGSMWERGGRSAARWRRGLGRRRGPEADAQDPYRPHDPARRLGQLEVDRRSPTRPATR